jgi:O-antigen/teichoic acid export membrane protein
MNAIKKILHYFGMDRAVGFGIMSRVWSLLAGPVTMLLVASRFSPEQQGYYYTFSSLLALQIFFDMGLLFVISQFVSHEFVHLSWGGRGVVTGESAALQRFTELLRKTVRWYAIAALLVMALLIPVGLIFLGSKGSADFSWQIPWVIVAGGTALNLLVTPFYAVIMGSGDVISANKRDLACSIVSSCLCWIVMILHGGLYASVAISLSGVVVSWGYLLLTRPELLKLSWQRGKSQEIGRINKLSWKDEVWPMQWRMAVSSGASYLMFQLFTPVLFHYQGAVIAGQMGITISAANALLGIGLTQLYAKSPLLGKLIAVRDWHNLDQTFYKTLRQSFTITAIGAVLGTGAIWYLQEISTFGQRFILYNQAGILFVTVCFQVVNSGIALYLRAHKQEPLVVMTVIASFLQGAATWYLGKRYSSYGVTLGFFFVSVFYIFPYVLLIWVRFRKRFHSPTSACGGEVESAAVC